MKMKSYNVQALRGHDYDDSEFQSDMKEIGIDIPDRLLYTRDIGPYVINEVHKQTSTGLPGKENMDNGQPYTVAEAKAVADQHRSEALRLYTTLLKA